MKQSPDRKLEELAKEKRVKDLADLTKKESKRVMLINRHKARTLCDDADVGLTNAFTILRKHDPEAANLVKKSIDQLRSALEYLR